MANYFDNSHIDGKKLTPEEIADAIRHKKYGIDVREAMAQGLEYCMTQAREIVVIEEKLTDLTKRVTNLEVIPDKVTKIQNDIDIINEDIAQLKRAVFGNGAVPIIEDNKSNSNQKQNIAKEVKLN